MKKSMVFAIQNTDYPLWKKVMFCSHFCTISELIWEPWDHISVSKWLPGSLLEKETKRQEQVEFKEEITSFFELEKVSKTD